MPPRLQLLSRASSIAQCRPYQPIAPFLYPFLQPARSASILSSLSDTPGSYSHRIRRGRGPSSGKGKTAGRGHKGQKQHGKVPVGFNGGQTPDWVVAGSRGFKNHFSIDMAPINLNRIQYWIDAGRLDPSQPITLKSLSDSKCIHRVKDGVKLLAGGKEELTSPINIVVSRASAEAIAAVEKLGGSVLTRYYTPFAMRKIIQGEMDPVHSLQSRINAVSLSADDGASETTSAALEQETSQMADAVAVDSQNISPAKGARYKYRLPDPTRRKHLEYYRDAAKRGYLSYLVGEGQSPSLFFKTPEELERQRRAVRKAKGLSGNSGQKSAVERLW